MIRVGDPVLCLLQEGVVVALSWRGTLLRATVRVGNVCYVEVDADRLHRIVATVRAEA